MTIDPLSANSLAGYLTGRDFVGLRRDLDDLSRQLTSGLRAQTYGGLGAERRVSLDARAKLAAMASHDAAIDGAELRLKLMSQGIEALSKAQGDVRAKLAMDAFVLGSDGRTTVQSAASQQLAAMIDILNTELDGRHLFAGRATDRAPVASAAVILDGDPARGLAGLRQLIAERAAADLGAGTQKLGRLGLAHAAGATSLTLSEAADAQTRASFGFRIVGATSSNPAAVTPSLTAGTAPAVTVAFAGQPADGSVIRAYVSRPDGGQEVLDLVAKASPPPGSATEFAVGATTAGSAANLQALLSGREVASLHSASPPGVSASFSGGVSASVSVDVAAQPADGDTLRVTLGLRDSTRTTIELTARAAPSPSLPGEYAIGATPADTAANLAAKLGAALDREARTTLAAASASLAGGDFFAASGTPGREPRRVAGPPFESATGFASAAAGRTVIWYAGDDTAVSARETALVPLDRGQSVAVGAQGNEPAIRSLVTQLGVLSATTFTTSDTDRARYLALSERVQTALRPSEGAQTLERVGTDLAQASAAMGAARERHAATRAVLMETIGAIENASPEEVGAAILQLQTRLEASYATTSLLARLSLVNYLQG